MDGVAGINVEQLRAAIAIFTAWPMLARGVRREVLAGALAVAPVVGLAIGILAGGASVAADLVAPALAGPVGVAVLIGLAGARPLIGLAAAADALLRSGRAAGTFARPRATPGVAGTAV